MFAGGVGLAEISIILVVVLIIFGAGKLPQVGEGLGKGIRNFKKEITRVSENEGNELEESGSS